MSKKVENDFGDLMNNIFSKFKMMDKTELRNGFIKGKTRIYKDENKAKVGDIADRIEEKTYKKDDEKNLNVQNTKVISELLKRQIEDSLGEI